MSSLAGYLRELAERGLYDKADIVNRFVKWEIEVKYMIMCHEKEDYRNLLGEYEYVAVKCAKRGNDVYQRRVENRLFGIKSRTANVQFDYWRKPYTNMLFVTLTYDAKRCSFVDAWVNLGTEFNLFNANLRKQYGKFSIFRTWESYESGYPHIHAIYLFEEHRFKVFPSYEKKTEGKTRLVWRIEDKDGLAKYWHSWVDVQAVQDLHGGIRYLEKYIMKCAKFNQEDTKGLMTLAMCWVFRKKSFYVSGQFRKALSDLIASLCSSKTRKIQLNLLNEQLRSNPWKVLGFIGAFLLGFNVEVWTFRLTTEQMERVFNEWEKTQQFL
jgi:hypothetical protein